MTDEKYYKLDRLTKNDGREYTYLKYENGKLELIKTLPQSLAMNYLDSKLEEISEEEFNEDIYP